MQFCLLYTSKVFYHVANTLSFSEASKQLFISQSAVSQSIKVLEKKLNQPLFIRSTKRVQLTPEGEILLKHIEPAMNLIKQGENQLLEANTLNGGQLRIGASDTICRYYLVPYPVSYTHLDVYKRQSRRHLQNFAQASRAKTKSMGLRLFCKLFVNPIDKAGGPVSYTHLQNGISKIQGVYM